MEATELWLVDLDKAAMSLDAIETATPRLSDDILRRLGEMRDERARMERRQTHIALRILLERRVGPAARAMPFVRSAFGKLSLASGSASFSLAHTRGLALIAVGDGKPIGVDIERMRAVRMPDSRRSPIEREAVALAAGAPLSAIGRDARFLSAWVRIEAVAKAQGHGVGPLLERLRPGRTEEPLPGAAANGRAPDPALVVHDITISAGVFAALACLPGELPPLLRNFPETLADIDAVLAGGGGTRR